MMIQAMMMTPRAGGPVDPLPGYYDGGTSSIELYFNTDGSISIGIDGGVPSVVQHWYSPATTSVGSSYWIRATQTGDTVTGSALGSWLQLSTYRSWKLSSGAGVLKNAYLTIQIASDSGGTTIVASSTTGGYWLEADNT